MPIRIQRERTEGWRMPAGAVYVGHPSRWGNGFNAAMYRARGYTGDDNAARAWCVLKYREQVAALMAAGVFDPAPLRGRDLVCWCRLDQRCHADVLLEVANVKGER